jgi:hypothetical protein
MKFSRVLIDDEGSRALVRMVRAGFGARNRGADHVHGL